jgi:bifunctional ADP-heptose synthase (sugar kinase/adenylyltransferase)
MLTAAVIDRILGTIPNRTIGLVGDLFLDRYFDIDASLHEPSVETGLTAYQVTGVRCYPGALGTVLNNLAALGVGRIHPITVIGDDGEGYELRKALGAIPAVHMSDIVVSADHRTPSYNKPMLAEAGAVRELNRLDIKNRTPTPDSVIAEVIRRLEAAWDQFDALLVLDQVSEDNCGVVTTAVREKLAELGARDPAKFVLADSRERIGLFRNVCVKPNAAECEKAVPNPDTADEDEEGLFQSRCIELARLHHCPRVFGTAGDRGIFLTRSTSEQGGGGYFIPAYPVTGPVDICGAGDSCSAAIACAMTAGCSPEAAAAFGNLVASITIQQIGVTGTASQEQVRRRWSEVGEGK